MKDAEILDSHEELEAFVGKVLPAGDWHCPQCICIHCGVIDGSDVGSDTSKCALQTCSLCEMKYHFTCLKEVDSKADKSNGSPFCGTECEEVSWDSVC